METSGGNSQGTYNFNGADDPFFQSNTLDGFANAYLGNFKTYTEGQRVLGLKSSVGLEAFVQDSWRVHRRLTLDLGVRFSHLPAMQDVSGNTTMFLPSSYNKALAERIFYPYCSVSAAAGQCPRANQYTWDPATNPNAVIGTGQGGPGNMYPSYVAPGTLVPAVFNGKSTGGYAQAPNPYTGMEQKGHVELIAEVERRYPEEWLAFVIRQPRMTSRQSGGCWSSTARALLRAAFAAR